MLAYNLLAILLVPFIPPPRTWAGDSIVKLTGVTRVRKCIEGVLHTLQWATAVAVFFLPKHWTL